MLNTLHLDPLQNLVWSNENACVYISIESFRFLWLCWHVALLYVVLNRKDWKRKRERIKIEHDSVECFWSTYLLMFKVFIHTYVHTFSTKWKCHRNYQLFFPFHTVLIEIHVQHVVKAEPCSFSFQWQGYKRNETKSVQMLIKCH